MIDGKTLSNLRLEDDVVLIINSTGEMYQLVNELKEVDEIIRLKINMKKTQMMTNQVCDSGIVQLDGIPLQKVDIYVYLGREVNMINEGQVKLEDGEKQHVLQLTKPSTEDHESDQRRELTGSPI
ncbi:hypothetical protein ANCDUO_07775 [Ancylostoma duodenale]|uniref:Reverse transcriptase domain-containing protein n=1 Tax=Ancylostoma duodenale TaxID=51022 RepID=A0A0C2GXT3_9BILA|nr:hypothetical protein ANCDUO_07775 [Ancylostoma duodenale]